MVGVGGSGDGVEVTEKVTLLNQEQEVKTTTSRSWLSCTKEGSRCCTPKRRFRSCEKPQAKHEDDCRPSIFTRFYSNSPRGASNHTPTPTPRECETISPQTGPKKITKRHPPANSEMQSRLDRLERMIEMLQQKHCRPKKEEVEKKEEGSYDDCDTPLPSIERDSDVEMERERTRDSIDDSASEISQRGKGSWKEIVGIVRPT